LYFIEIFLLYFYLCMKKLTYRWLAMNIVEGRTGLRRLSVPRRSAERGDSSDRRQGDRRQATALEDNDIEQLNVDEAPKKFVRVSLTPGERTLIQDMYLIEDE
jgi:hypothetical protein